MNWERKYKNAMFALLTVVSQNGACGVCQRGKGLGLCQDYPCIKCNNNEYEMANTDDSYFEFDGMKLDDLYNAEENNTDDYKAFIKFIND
jgi:hypothetical protein